VDEDLSRTRGLAWRDVGLCRDKDPNLVDMRDVSGVDPSAVTLFQDAVGWARHRGARFYLHAPSPATADRLTAERSIRDIILV
jgi:anti-anti-sigma regulatory factor